MKNLKKILAALLTLALILALSSVSLADGIGAVGYEKRGGEYAEDYEYTGKMQLGKADADGHCGAGAILIRKEDGSTVGGAGLTVSGEAKAEVAEASGKLRAGTEEYNMHAGGSVAIVKTGVKGAATVGMDDKGNVQMNANGSAEVNLAEANGNIGTTIGGVDFGINGSVKVGIGVKANIGYSDGKLHCEVGAALGVGGSVGFDLDVGAIGKKVSEATKTTTNAITSAFKVLWNHIF